MNAWQFWLYMLLIHKSCGATTPELNTTSSGNFTVTGLVTSPVVGTSNDSTTMTTPAPVTSNVPVTRNLEDEKVMNAVMLKFYNLLLSKFNESVYSNLLAEKVTTYCMQKSCGLLNPITFTSSHIINSLEQSSRDLEITTLVLYTNDSSNTTVNFLLPKSTLRSILIDNREDFRLAVGRDIIEVDGETFSIKANVSANTAISLIFSFITVILLVAVLLIRNSYLDEEYKRYKQAVHNKRREEDSLSYKIKPGPEPIIRHPSVKFARKQRRPSETTKTTQLDTGTQLANTEKGQTNGHSRYSSNSVQPLGNYQVTSTEEYSPSTKLPPLNELENPRRKKRSKKSKRREREAKLEENQREHHTDEHEE